MAIQSHAFLRFTPITSAQSFAQAKTFRSFTQATLNQWRELKQRTSQSYPTPLNLLAAGWSQKLAEKINNYLNI